MSRCAGVFSSQSRGRTCCIGDIVTDAGLGGGGGESGNGKGDDFNYEKENIVNL